LHFLAHFDISHGTKKTATDKVAEICILLMAVIINKKNAAIQISGPRPNKTRTNIDIKTTANVNFLVSVCIDFLESIYHSFFLHIYCQLYWLATDKRTPKP
jgi:hypothetical protein